MSQNLQNFVKFQKFQLDNLVDFEKCCKTHIFLQKSEPIQPKTSNILPKFCQPTLSMSSLRKRRSPEAQPCTSKEVRQRGLPERPRRSRRARHSCAAYFRGRKRGRPSLAGCWLTFWSEELIRTKLATIISKTLDDVVRN